MGYEVKLYIGTVSEHSSFDPDSKEDPPPRWLHTYAMVDLHKPGYDSSIGAISDGGDGKGERIYFYADDGNTQITEDRYGKKLRAIPLDEVEEALNEDVKRDGNGGYFPFHAALGVIREVKKHGKSYKMKAVLYGH